MNKPWLALLLLFIAPAAYSQRSVTVTASGSASTKPDYAVLSIMLSAQDQTAQGAFARIDESASTLRKTMAGVGISSSDVDQQGMALNPSYDYSGGGGAPPKLAGYHLMATYTIKVRTLKDLAKVIDAGSLAGASNVSISSYGVVDEERMEEGATKAALAEAHEKAERLAQAMGGKLGEIISITPPDPSGGGMSEMEREEQEHRGGIIVAGSNAQTISRSTGLKVTYSVK